MPDIHTTEVPGDARPAPNMIWVRHCPLCQAEIAKRRAWDEWACPRCGWHGA